MSEKVNMVLFNTINVGAISFTFVGVEQVLTILVLLSAFAYNLKKMSQDD